MKFLNKKWGETPSGEFWDAFVLVRNFRDVMQKALWTKANNPNTPALVKAFKAMAADPSQCLRFMRKQVSMIGLSVMI